MEIKGKKAVVVGGASGMARASAEMLRDRGASVAILDLPTSRGADVAKACAETLCADCAGPLGSVRCTRATDAP